MKDIFFNAHHSPIGAFASFTTGCIGACGGLGLELGTPANNQLYIGLQSRDGSSFETLPFYSTDIGDDAKRFDVEHRSSNENAGEINVKNFLLEDIKRKYELSIDTFTAGDLTFKIYSPVRPISDPNTANDEELKQTILPAVFVQISVDNTKSDITRKVFFGYTGNDPYSSMRSFNLENNYKGIAQGKLTGIVTNDNRVYAAHSMTILSALTHKFKENYDWALGQTCVLCAETPAFETATYNFAVCFYRGDVATSGMDMKYYYTRFFDSLEDVGRYATENFTRLVDNCVADNTQFSTEKLSDEQKFMLYHSIRSYYGSTQLMNYNGAPFWIVNEGEYRMINTMDLTVDQLFYEMKMNPWTVKNELDMFAKYYSYHDSFGISFTHDMGVANVFSKKGSSCYEQGGLTGCFSYMTHEELTNWLCCAVVYINGSNDKKWLSENIELIKECLQSMLNRDNKNPALRNGLMGFDSDKTITGAEITTYDSLDVSLGQSRNNIYLSGKCFGVYVALEKIFKDEQLIELASVCEKQATLCAETITNGMLDEGYIPAILNENNKAKIIPAIEGLVIPYFTNCTEALDEGGKYGSYIKALKKHITTVLKKGVCLFDDGGWKITSTSNNSWLSKVYLSQFIVNKILNLNVCTEEADKVHKGWLTNDKSAYYSWSDQMVLGVATGSKYYPRGVTSILWTNY